MSSEKFWTFEDYQKLPQDGKRYEIIDGVLYVSPSPVTIHQALSTLLGGQLLQLQKAGLGWVLLAPMDVLMPGATPVQPDLVFVGSDQPDIITPENIQGVPKLLVEILSPSNPRYDRVTKLNWLYRLDGSTYAVLAALGPGDRFEHPDFPGLVLDLDDLYSQLPPGVVQEA